MWGSRASKQEGSLPEAGAPGVTPAAWHEPDWALLVLSPSWVGCSLAPVTPAWRERALVGCWLTPGARSQPPACGSELARLGVVWGPLGNLGTGPCRQGPLSGSPSQDQLVDQVLGVCFLHGFYVPCMDQRPSDPYKSVF